MMFIGYMYTDIGMASLIAVAIIVLMRIYSEVIFQRKATRTSSFHTPDSFPETL